MKLIIKPLRLEISASFATAHGQVSHRDAVWVGLEQEGNTGWGEATCVQYYGITPERLFRALERVRTPLLTLEITHPEIVYEQLQPVLADEPFALCALDMAAYDLYGKLHGHPTWKYLDLSVESVPLSSLTIGLIPVDQAVEFLESNPWPVYKIKLGGLQDRQLVEAVRNRTSATIRVDANAGWTPAEAVEMSAFLKAMDVEFIEQPLPATDLAGIRIIQGKMALPIMADESCHLPDDVVKCSPYYDAINIKLMKCGGITPARTMISEARQLGLKIMIGCMTETSVGISAAAQLLPLVDYADIDGPFLLKEDPAEGVRLVHGVVTYPDTPGNGCTPSSHQVI